ncbi:hypothetical protein [Persicobacter psychrovividus]|uniref:Uncharacterized protein n=1 Tax=Persicobacter psychrovividus TaxID=387638 RepID=A0ABM7VDU2_9BACT|nr:hypothetical protein PEPS_13890 [Persicobacter psychrovividus]
MENKPKKQGPIPNKQQVLMAVLFWVIGAILVAYFMTAGFTSAVDLQKSAVYLLLLGYLTYKVGRIIYQYKKYGNDDHFSE